ncbi:MAG TPA: UDP-N-acetylmuramoyl-tripeptide--D-alanyl-D-alanine ligase [Flavobacterium sp.]|jgi:UDP-N-acetylmuramoyl-tripeptide--D-alanyl-D-alanine ligase
MQIQDLHSLFLKCTGVVTDTRKVVPGTMFLALKGERFDANTFASEALEKGASYVVIDNPAYQIDSRTVLVEDGLLALQQLATFHRKFLGIPIISLTGSNGKTTTKELINAVLSRKYKTGATIGNLNNHIGVPLTLLSFTKETEIGIVEMGANHQREIDFLCQVAQPDYGYITNFGKAHLEGFGGINGVIKGKSEMYDHLQQHDKLAFVNLEDQIQADKTASLKRFTFGRNADVAIDNITADPFVEVSFAGTSVKSNMIGLYNANNIAAAIAIGVYFKVSADDIKQAIENYVPANNRSQIVRKNSNEIILDAYNANPSSMKVAIGNFLQLSNPNKVLFLGDMFELGEESAAEHRSIVESLQHEVNVECHFVGTHFFAAKSAKPDFHFHNSFEALAEHLHKKKYSNSLLLIKGSRGMALERLLELI